ncbi:MAG: hypothetical protein EOM26_01400 [Alphaproteobacteria bacterium]|nr:hypothetical protein [Alphaproteobacteria bacterium]
MARTLAGTTDGGQTDAREQTILSTHSTDSGSVTVPGNEFISHAELIRDGHDLVLKTPDGSIVIEGYFLAEPAPDIVSPEGAVLTPGLVSSFVHSPPQYAQLGTLNDTTPVGSVQEVSGEVTVTRTNGTVENVQIGTPIFQGDVVETDAAGAVNIVFIDETSFAVSENARLAIDEYVFDPVSQSGESNFSVLRGIFVFTSGLIGRDDPDDVQIETPVGSIGIRGTTIAGNVDTGEITVVEGAIVLRTHGGQEVTLAGQFETARFDGGNEIIPMGQLNANDVAAKFSSIGKVTPSFFNAIGRSPQNDNGDKETAPEESSSEEAAGDEAAGEEASAEETATDESGTENAGETTETQKTAAEPSETTTTTTANTSTGTTTTSTNTLASDTLAISGYGTSLTGTDSTGSSSATDSSVSGTTTADTTTTDSSQSISTPQATNGTTANDAPYTETTDDTTTSRNDFDLAASRPGVFALVSGNLNQNGIAIAALGDIDKDGDIEFGYLSYTSGDDLVIEKFSGTSFESRNTALVSDGAAWSDVTQILNATLAGLGDVNGDGKADYIVGMPGRAANVSEAPTYSGNVRIGTATLIDSGGTAMSADDGFGYSVAALGDINLDGFADFAFSAPNSNGGKGGVYTIWGSATTLDGPIDLYNLGSLGIELQGPGIGSAYGEDIHSAGDFNGDGMGDLIIGAPGSNKAFVMAGGDFSNTLLAISGPAGSVVAENFGHGVLGGIDLNDDSYDDIIVAGDGEAWIVYGGQTGMLDVSTMTATQGFKVIANDPNDGGSWRITNGGTAGDFNGDGYADMVVVTTIPDASAGGYANDIYIVYGGRNPDADGDGIVNVMSLDEQGKAFKMIWDGAFNGDDLNVSVAGDVNGDGFDDLMVANELTGEILMVYGRDAENVVLKGQDIEAMEVDQSLVGGSGADILGDGGKTGLSMKGGAGNDILEVGTFIGDQHRVLDGGSDIDTLRIVGVSANPSGLDFSLVDRLSSIERIDMANDQNDKITLDTKAIFDMADGTLFHYYGNGSDDAYTLRINGESGDELTIQGAHANEWMSNADANEAGYTGYVHESGNYAVLVDNDVTVNVLP